MVQYINQLINLSNKLGQQLKEKSYMLALAESCTGGLAAANITEVAGSSAWFDRGFVTYSNAAKQSLLDVSSATLNAYGAVSEQTAQEMVMGAIQHSNADIAASVTGIAGPTGGSTEKPVGTVCFAYLIKNGQLMTETKQFAGDRQSVRHQSIIQLMNGLMDLLQAE